MSTTDPLHLAVALEGAGWHPAAWREDDARPGELFSASYWVDLAREAERGGLDFLTIEDALGIQSAVRGTRDARTDQVRGRLDAVLIAARLAPVTTGIGLVPTVVTAHTEPFHVSKAIATLDYVSTGRAGLRVQAGGHGSDAAHFGRRSLPLIGPAGLADPEVARAVAELFEESADYVEVVRRLWDSWEDDAEIRDVATGRFVDREKLHYIDFEGRAFSVKGPSITPRPPQGQPLVAALAHAAVAYRLAVRAADVVFVTPHDADSAKAIVDEIRAEERAAGRTSAPLAILADIEVYLDREQRPAAARKARLDDTDGAEHGSDALQFTGTPGELADLLLGWRDAGIAGYRLRPGVLPHDLRAISRHLVPELRARGAFRHRYEAGTLRGLLGLGRPANRYAVA